MKRMMAGTVLAVFCMASAALAADSPAETAAKTLKDRGVMPFVEKAAGFVHLVARQDMNRIEKAYGMNDQMRDTLSSPELTDALKTIDVSLPFDMDVVAFDILDAQTCSMLFVIHGTNGPIGIKVYMQPSKGNLVHRVEFLLNWEEIETLAHRMEKLPIGYTITVNKIQEDRP